MNPITEQQLENLSIEWFLRLDWTYTQGPGIAPDGESPARTDYRQTVLRERLLAALFRINPHVPAAALEQAAHELLTVSEPVLIARNRRVYRLLLAQLAAEIGGERTVKAKKRCPNIVTQDKPRPRLYWWGANPLEQAQVQQTPDEAVLTDVDVPLILQTLSEHDLYPLLMEFLHKDLKLYCQRINEKTSKNSYGNGGNRWLHPDIVALEPLDQHWDAVVKDCVRHGNDSSVRLWSFEVKKRLTRNNVRECFFQAVSNSSWANFGYLVATGLNNDVEDELQMLASLHGIGVLLLDTDSLYDSQILIPARLRTKIDWQSVNRIVSENSDFHRFVEQVGIHNQTGRLIKSVWNK